MRFSTKRERTRIKSIGELGTSASENRFIAEFLKPYGYTQIKPEDCGALTDAPLITDGKGNVWGFMNYQVQAFLIELVAGNTILWQKG